MTRLHHLALGARDVARVAEFYRDVLGLSELKRHHEADGSLRSVWLSLGHAVLMVEARTSQPRPSNGDHPGIFLLAVSVDGDPAGVEARLHAAGVPIESRTEHTAYARDPEGNRVAVSSYPLGALVS